MTSSTRKPFIASARLGAKLSTSREAHVARARAAIVAAGLPVNTFTASAGNRDSDTLVALENGSLLLVSYETIVAFKLPRNDQAVCVTLGHYSRTTDRAIREFSPAGVFELPLEKFVHNLRAATV
jgi:hypothetical protein